MKITKFKLIEKNTLIAFFDVEICKWGNFQIHGLQLHKKGNQSWINFPQFKIEGEDGKPKYLSHCHFSSREIHDEFSKKVMPLLSQELQKVKAAPQGAMECEDEGIPF